MLNTLNGTAKPNAAGYFEHRHCRGELENQGDLLSFVVMGCALD